MWLVQSGNWFLILFDVQVSNFKYSQITLWDNTILEQWFSAQAAHLNPLDVWKSLEDLISSNLNPGMRGKCSQADGNL